MLFYVSCGILGVTWVGVLWLVKKLYNSQTNAVYWDELTNEEKKKHLDDDIDDHMSRDPRRKKEE